MSKLISTASGIGASEAIEQNGFHSITGAAVKPKTSGPKGVGDSLDGLPLPKTAARKPVVLPDLSFRPDEAALGGEEVDGTGVGPHRTRSSSEISRF
jgi:hypothetical protein